MKKQYISQIERAVEEDKLKSKASLRKLLTLMIVFLAASGVYLLCTDRDGGTFAVGASVGLCWKYTRLLWGNDSKFIDNVGRLITENKKSNKN